MNQGEVLISIIENPAVQEFISMHEKEEATSLSIKYASKVPFNLAMVVKQIELRQKSKHKIAEFVTNKTLLLPKLFEQCTHELVAKFKAGIIHGDSLLDGTAGLGIDSFYLGRNFKTLVCLEANTEHATILSHNFNIHRISADIRNNTLEVFISQDEHLFDVIYIDPDRRPDAKRIFQIEQGTPNVLELKNNLLQKGKEIWIKLSPMLDIHEIIQKFSPQVTQVYAIALNNEMKEILICLKPGVHSVIYHAVNITKEKTDHFTADALDMKPQLSNPGKYFFEPNVALVKSKLSMPYAVKSGLMVLYPHGYYFTTDTYFENLQGRIFEIAEAMSYKKANLQQFIKKNNIKKINISCRNFYWKPEEVKKQLKVNDGGEWYLFCYTTLAKNSFAVWCRKLL